jgi:hypothetical protein
MSGGLLFTPNPDRAEFECFVDADPAPLVYHFTITNAGRLEVRDRKTTDPFPEPITCAAAFGGATALGTAGGTIWTLAANGSPRAMTAANQLRVREAGASGAVLAFIGENTDMGFIPLDYRELEDDGVILLEKPENYTRIAANPRRDAQSPGTFLFWQPDNTQRLPMVRRIAGAAPRSSPENAGSDSRDGIDDSRIILNKLSLRFPLRSASILGDHALFLDSAGNVSVVSLSTGNSVFSFSSMGSLDAAFIDEKNIIIGRSAISGNTPFLMVNIETGETVPLAYPASIGARVYRGISGAVYGATVDGTAGNPKTSILRLNLYNAGLSSPLVEYQGEDTSFGIAECAGALASTIGGDGATLYRAGAFISFERSPGLPIRLINGDSYFITIDEDGNISWHESHSGGLLALLRLYESEWILEKAGGRTLRGKIIRP